MVNIRRQKIKIVPQPVKVAGEWPVFMPPPLSKPAAFDGGAYLLAVAALLSPSPNQGSYQHQQAT